jgi:hypothetical protein
MGVLDIVAGGDAAIALEQGDGPFGDVAMAMAA